MIQITFKSGAQIEVDASKFDIHRSPVSGDLLGVNWTTPPDFTAKLVYLRDLDDIAAIVHLDDPATSEPA